MDLPPSPFPSLGLELFRDDIRETAYEIIAAACKAPQVGLGRSKSGISSMPQPLQRSPTPLALSRMKQALGLRPKAAHNEQVIAAAKAKKSLPAITIVRLQLGISEQTDARIRRALSRTAAGQIGKHVELILLPLELLQHIRLADFADPREYLVWQRRQLKVLEAGLLLHPAVQLEQSNIAAQRLKKLIQSSTEKPLETGKTSETMLTLRSAAASLASRTDDETRMEACHWADGFPFNLHLYQMLLSTYFDRAEEAVVIDEIDEVTELIKKTWGILGIDQAFHNVCFMWVLFRQFVITGQNELDLLGAVETQLAEVSKDAKLSKDSQYALVLRSVLTVLQSWGDKRFLAYHDAFPTGAKGMIDVLLPVTLNAEKILSEDLTKEYPHRRNEVDIISARVEGYVRSSLRSAFAQIMEQNDTGGRHFEEDKGFSPALAVLVEDTMALIAKETKFFSPTLKNWHPFAAGLAAATLHSCFRKELEQFLQGIKVLTPRVMEVLQSADQLEKVLVHVAVEDAADCEDGGRGLIREMTPFDTYSAILNLSKSWIKENLDNLKQWVDRNIQQEEWDPQAIRWHYAPSVVEVFRMIEETIDAFYALPVAGLSDLLQELVVGIDGALQHYALQCRIGRGSKKDFIPSFPALSRCRVTKHCSKFGLLWKKENVFSLRRSNTQQEQMNGTWKDKIEISELPSICVQINTLYYIQTELVSLETRISSGWQKDNTSDLDSNLSKSFRKAASSLVESNGQKAMVERPSIRFKNARNGAEEGIQHLCEVAVYKAIFHDLKIVFGDGLYSGGVTRARISQLLEPLEMQLEIIANTVHDQLRNRVISALMKACFEGLLMVLLAGGPSRFFSTSDAEMLDEDFVALKDLFKANGEGLPSESVEKAAIPVTQILALFAVDTTDIIETFRSTLLEAYGARSNESNGFKLPLPTTSGQWKPTDANTLLHILCHRSDKVASKFLKRTYNLPKADTHSILSLWTKVKP